MIGLLYESGEWSDYKLASELAEAGCECAFFTAKDYSSPGGDFRRGDAAKLAALALGTVVGMARKGEEDNG